MMGYSEPEKAVAAAKRLRKIDIQDGLKREKYEIIDGEGNFVKEL